MPAYYTNKLSVTTFAQQTNYWCGPASLKQAIHAVQGTSLEQSQYASLLGTTSSGTSQTAFASVINSQLGISRYTHVQVSTLTDAQFYNIIKNSINLGYPPIMHVRMEYLPIYNGHTGGHFVTVSGHTITSIVNGDYSAIQFYYVDPNNANYGNGSTLGEQTVSFTDFKQAGSQGYITYAQ